jgi:hypothetical protein
VLRAVAVAQGELGTRSSSDLTEGQSLVEDVPKSLDLGSPIAACYVFDPTATPCGPPFIRDDTKIDAITTAGAAPPLFYALVGLPLRVSPDARGLLLARLVHAGACAALIATAAVVALRARRRGFLLVGLSVAVTPMACYLTGIINPSGLEIAAGITTWVLLLVTTSEAVRPPRWVLGALVVAGGVLVLSRALSAAFFGLMVVVTILALGWRPFDLRDRRILVAAAALGGAFVLAVAWVLTHDPTALVPARIIRPASGFDKVMLSVGKTGQNLEQMVAAFGWLDVRYPRGVHFTWLFVGTVLLLLAMHLSRSTRGRVALGLLLAASFLLPLAIELPGYDEYGLIFQGRYVLPVVVGIPLLSGVLLDRAPAGSLVALDTSRRTLLAALWFAHCLAFWFFLRRYTMGADASWVIPWDVEWSPRLHPWVLTLIVALASGEWARWLATRGALEDEAPATS